MVGGVRSEWGCGGTDGRYMCRITRGVHCNKGKEGGGIQERTGRRVYWWLMEARRREWVALWRVLTDLLPEYILRDLHSGATARLGGHYRRATVLFADLVGYTTMWHQLSTRYHDRPLLRRQVAPRKPCTSRHLLGYTCMWHQLNTRSIARCSAARWPPGHASHFASFPQLFNNTHYHRQPPQPGARA